MVSKDVLVTKIKEWIKLENEMKVLQAEVKLRRAKKKALSEELVGVMKEHDIDCFDMKDSKLLYTQNKVKAPLSKKHLLGCLQNYFDQHPNVDGEEVAQYILDKREVKVKEGIRHKVPKAPKETE